VAARRQLFRYVVAAVGLVLGIPILMFLSVVLGLSLLTGSPIVAWLDGVGLGRMYSGWVFLLAAIGAGAVSGFGVLLLMLALGRWLSIDFDAWPNLSSLWLLWVLGHAIVGGVFLYI